jgi:hypothetical protein
VLIVALLLAGVTDVPGRLYWAYHHGLPTAPMIPPMASTVGFAFFKFTIRLGDAIRVVVRQNALRDVDC